MEYLGRLSIVVKRHHDNASLVKENTKLGLPYTSEVSSIIVMAKSMRSWRQSWC